MLRYLRLQVTYIGNLALTMFVCAVYNNNYYLSSLSMKVGKGLLRVMQINWNAVADIVPVDHVNNMLIAVGWMTAMNK